MDSDEITAAQQWVNYPRASEKSPDVSDYPLPPDLNFPVTLRLVSTNDAHPTDLIVSARAFELCTPVVLRQSVSCYFRTHIAEKKNLGLYPCIETASIVVQRGAADTELLQSGPLYTDEWRRWYEDNFRSAALLKRLEGVIAHVDWGTKFDAEIRERGSIPGLSMLDPNALPDESP